MRDMESSKCNTIVICQDCDAHYLKGYKHICPTWLKKLKKRFTAKKENEKNKSNPQGHSRRY